MAQALAAEYEGQQVRGDAEGQKKLLDSLLRARQEQMLAQTDSATEASAGALEQSLADAQEQYRAQRDRTAAEAQRAMDNSALYAEMRGDRGGIGRAQYDSVQNTAAASLASIDLAQTKLASDTARQIEQLRAQGEYKKADALLGVTQDYLSQLLSLSRWAQEQDVNGEKLAEELRRWQAEYELSAEKYRTDSANEARRLTDSENENRRKVLAQAGEAMISLGLAPTAEQLNAMGWTQDQYRARLSLRR